MMREKFLRLRPWWRIPRGLLKETPNVHFTLMDIFIMSMVMEKFGTPELKNSIRINGMERPDLWLHALRTAKSVVSRVDDSTEFWLVYDEE